MSANSRMSLAVHILTWLAYDRRGTDKETATSQRIATSVNTNPVVIRRSLGRLKDHGLVTIDHGKGGGWSLARDAASITLLDVYCASSDDPVFGLHASDPDAECYVGYGIQPVLTRIYDRATEALRQSLAQDTIADVLRETVAVYAAGDHPPPQPRVSS
ncbi:MULTISPECIES: Rrf2 family transcriptional regulator [Streptomyces]|uniref:Rrf2 family transcriptional regulator n=1 Tax=Streptomyces TaxID=1883 RepID=UPI0002DA8B73|nr:Rrf2 family transcriptional regulator [Streptomyces xiaopingdaonensis]